VVQFKLSHYQILQEGAVGPGLGRLGVAHLGFFMACAIATEAALPFRDFRKVGATGLGFLFIRLRFRLEPE
jgi:hypothetical protein